MERRMLMVSTHGYFEGNPSFGRADTGGQIVFVIDLSKALAKLGYKVDILSRQFEDFEQIEQLAEDVRIVRVPCDGRDFIPKEYLVESLPELIDSFIKFCQQNSLEYDSIDSHYWDAGFVGTKLASIFNIPHVFTPHSLGVWKETQMRQSSIEQGITINEAEFEKEYNFKRRNETEKSIMGDVVRVVATTPEQKKIMSQNYGIPSEKIAIIPPGFSPDKYYPIDKNNLSAILSKHKLPERFVFAVGRITPYKGYDLLIKAFKYVVQEVPDIKLVLAIGSHEPGEVEKRKELAQLTKSLGLADNVLFFGHVEELEGFYNAAEVVVMPSTYEPFGMVAIEGMACNTPAVVTARGGLRDFLIDGEDALIVDPLDIQTLAGTIVRLLKDKSLYQDISRKGYEKAYSTFTWERIAESTLSIIA